VSLVVIGKATPKKDGADKVTGRTRFLHDLVLPRMASGKILRSRHPHARLVRIDTRRAAALPGVLAYRSRLPAPLIPGSMVHAEVVNGPWRRLVFGHPAYADGAVNRHAYTFCVLEQFWRHLKRREIYAGDSTKWRNPQAGLLEGEAWQAIRADVLTTLASENAALCRDYLDRDAVHVYYGLNTRDFPVQQPTEWVPNTPVRIAAIGNDRDRDWDSLIKAYGNDPRYTVRLGDTLFSIARRFGTTVAKLQAANGIANPNRIFAGQVLVIVR